MLRYIHFISLILIFFSISCQKEIRQENPNNLNPIASFSYTVVGTLPVTISFINTSSGLPGSIFNWNFGDGATSTVMNPTHNYIAFGVFNVTLTQTSITGSTESVTTSININSSGNGGGGGGGGGTGNTSFVYSLPSAAPYSVTFTNTSTNGSSYLWNFGDGGTSTSNNTILNHIYNIGGSYTVKLVVTGSGGIDSTSKVLNLQ